MSGLLKTPLYIANFLLMLSGAAVCAVGGYAAHALRSPAYASPLLVGSGAGAALAGAAAAAAAAYGCWALHKRDHNALCNYSKMIIVVMILHGALGFAAFELDSDIGDEAEKLVDSLGPSSLHAVERHFWCCGKAGVETYHTASGQYELPESCCPPMFTSMCLQKSYHFSSSCNGAVRFFAFQLALKVAIGSIVFFLFEIVLVMFGKCLAGHFQKLHAVSTSYEMSRRPSSR